jgi:hypothetical protein
LLLPRAACLKKKNCHFGPKRPSGPWCFQVTGLL